ncbi:EAL domain-containing protein [Gallaecimonas sp. GXIMD4217]|uniref:EAL domain-containing response regulator n=1 Tax=Gallaecimonas sp. GXIMD4217 TaxID=3131927 RepID=UPI00311B09E2
MRIVIVEDDPHHEQLISHQLRKLGEEIHVFQSVTEASDFMAPIAQPFDLLVCHLHPGTEEVIDFLRFCGETNQCRALLFYSSIEAGVLYAMGVLARHFGLHFLGALNRPARLIELESKLALLENWLDAQSDKAALRLIGQCSKDDILQAMELDQFHPYVQAKHRPSGEISGVEILARWLRDDSLIPPAAFIEQIDKLGLADPFAFHLLEKALRDLKDCPGIRLSLNLTPLVVLNASFSDQLLTLCDRYQFQPERLTLEMDEGAYAPDNPETIENLARVRLHGVNVALDHFGTGAVSLVQLCEQPISELKIDKSFYLDLKINDKKMTAMQAIAQLCKAMSFNLVMEGIETTEHQALARELEADEVQGFLYSAPMSIPAFVKLYLDEKAKATGS